MSYRVMSCQQRREKANNGVVDGFRNTLSFLLYTYGSDATLVSC